MTNPANHASVVSGSVSHIFFCIQSYHRWLLMVLLILWFCLTSGRSWHLSMS